MIRTVSIAFTAGAVIAAGIALVPQRGEPTQDVEQRKSDCQQALEEIDRAIAFHRKRFERSGWWIDLEQVAIHHLSRAHLTGSFRDYAEAERALQEAFARAEPKSGPFLARARLNFALHRFDRVEADLAAAESPLLGGDERRAIAEMRADLLLNQERHREAEAAYLAAVEEKRTITALARLAQYRWKTADFEAADALLGDASRSAKGEPRAWLELQRGQMDLERGRFLEAKRHFEDAERAFSGWYLVEEHLAEAMVGLGEEPGAIARYRRLASRTGLPQHLHALAELLESRGERREAHPLRQEAMRRFGEQIAAYPEAYAAHAQEHLHGHLE